jgi:hypothetical protein
MIEEKGNWKKWEKMIVFERFSCTMKLGERGVLLEEKGKDGSHQNIRDLMIVREG